MQTKLLWPLLKHIKWVKNPDEYRKLHISSIFYRNPERVKFGLLVNNMLKFWTFIPHGVRTQSCDFGYGADSAIRTKNVVLNGINVRKKVHSLSSWWISLTLFSIAITCSSLSSNCWDSASRIVLSRSDISPS